MLSYDGLYLCSDFTKYCSTSYALNGTFCRVLVCFPAFFGFVRLFVRWCWHLCCMTNTASVKYILVLLWLRYFIHSTACVCIKRCGWKYKLPQVDIESRICHGRSARHPEQSLDLWTNFWLRCNMWLDASNWDTSRWGKLSAMSRNVITLIFGADLNYRKKQTVNT